MVVLVDNQTASAAELLSAALSDNGAAVLVGENTYGKGTAQSIIPLESGGALKITTAEYITPEGTRVEGQGLAPDYYVATPELQAFFALRLLEPGIYPIKFNINNQEVVAGNETINSGSTPLYRNGTYYLPLRFTLEALGYTVHWNGYSGEITANRGESELVVNSRGEIWLNGKPLNITNGVIFENERSYMPVGLLSDMGCRVDFNLDYITVWK